MAFTLDSIVPWGRSLAEYRDMFRLTTQDLKSRILGCGDGPASFNAELTGQGGQVLSVDPLYGFRATNIEDRIAETFSTVLHQARDNARAFVWDSIPSVEALGRVRMQAMQRFLRDYRSSGGQGRYLCAELPDLPLKDRSFDLALCSHLLFLYGRKLPLEFHVRAVTQMCRVAREVRIFPLLELDGSPSPHLGAVQDVLRTRGHEVIVVGTDYDFQRGGNEMPWVVCASGQ